MSPADLARKTGWSEAKVSRIRSGKQGVSVMQLGELETATGASVSFLLGRDDFAKTDDERALLTGYRLASEREQMIGRALFNAGVGAKLPE